MEAAAATITWLPRSPARTHPPGVVGVADSGVQLQKGMRTGLLRQPSPHLAARVARIWQLTLKGLVQARMEQRYLPGGLF